jgi:CheY-like chemotaxis protein
MEGLDFFKELTKNRKLRDIPFLMITADKEWGKVVEASFKEYIVKPVKPEISGNKIKKVVFGTA